MCSPFVKNIPSLRFMYELFFLVILTLRKLAITMFIFNTFSYIQTIIITSPLNCSGLYM